MADFNEPTPFFRMAVSKAEPRREVTQQWWVRKSIVAGQSIKTADGYATALSWPGEWRDVPVVEVE